jgi:hypothetical protein
MLPTEDYARKLNADLEDIGNGPDAIKQLLAALERSEAIENWQPSIAAWADYDAYLDRLDASRLAQEPEVPLTTPQRWTAWLARAPLPSEE